jgi:hypothetical protein
MTWKKDISQTQRQPNHYTTPLEPWSTWYAGENNQNKVEQIIHDIVYTESKQYWISKDKANAETKNLNNATPMKRAIKESSLPRRIFIYDKPQYKNVQSWKVHAQMVKIIINK